MIGNTPPGHVLAAFAVALCALPKDDGQTAPTQRVLRCVPDTVVERICDAQNGGKVQIT